MDEDQSKAGEKDSEFREMQQQIREAQHVIAQFYQESREMKRKLAERGSEEKTPQSKTYPMQEISKDKEVMHNPKTIVLAKPISPLTISSARKKSLETQAQLAASEKPPTSPTEGEKNIRWVNK
jgi:Ser-tRNA(Ala) deacylase AlaX